MENNNTILKLMINHHTLIEALFTLFKDAIGKELEITKEAFNNLKWEAEKHIFVEEKAIFNLADSSNIELRGIMPDLIREHSMMINMLKGIENDLTIKKHVDISGFTDLFQKHKGVEEKSLYPALDRELSSLQKKIIIARINEVSFAE